MAKYTSEFVNIIKQAQQIGIKNKITYLGTEEIVYAILTSNPSFAQRVLNNYGLYSQNYLPYLRKTFQLSNPTKGYTPNTSSVLQLSVKISAQANNNFVSSDHLLLAILSTKDCCASQIFRAMGLDVNGMIKALTTRLNSLETSNVQEKNEETSLGNDFNYQPPNLEELEEFGYNLTEKAVSGKLDPIIGRDKEITEIIGALARKNKNSPVLIGEPGVGKSAIIEGLAQKIVARQVPDVLIGKTIFSLDLASILSGAKYRGDFEERFKKAIDVIIKNDIIVFIDEIHNLVGAGKAEGSMDATEIIKPLLARGELHLIGATTFNEYTRYIEPDAALCRRFQQVIIPPPSIEDAIRIINGIKSKYEAHHRVEIREDAIREAVVLSEKYIGDKQLPDKAIDLIDECASQARLQACAPEKQMSEIIDKVNQLDTDMSHAYHTGDATRFNKLKAERELLVADFDKIKQIRLDIQSGQRPYIDGQDIAKLISLKTKIPVSRLTKEESERLLTLESELHARVIGQDQAVQAVAKALKRARVGLNDDSKPLGSFIFVGPTGVGKTELAKTLAESMFGDEKFLIKIDMTEYMQKEDVTKLIGAPPGYAGYDEEGYLTSRVRREPYSVVLFDEIEKAHPDIFNILLQVLDEGRLTDNKGRTVNFRNTIIILTSNLGVLPGEISQQEEEQNINLALKRNFRPEFLNRIDEIVHFKHLTKKECSEIVLKILRNLEKKLKKNDITVVFENSCINAILTLGYSYEYGARKLNTIIRKQIADMITERLIAGDIKSGDKISMYAHGTLIDYKII